MTNLLLLPGLGTILAGRRSGWFQLTLSLIGFALAIAGGYPLMRQYAQTRTVPAFGEDYHLIFLGLLMLMAGWSWSIFTGLQIYFAARRSGKNSVTF